MIENQDIRPAQVIGPLGEPLTLADLPAPETKRWVVRRKAEVVAAVNGGLLTLDEALARYGLRLKNLLRGSARSIVWMHGLRVTKIQTLPRPVRAPNSSTDRPRPLAGRPPVLAPA